MADIAAFERSVGRHRHALQELHGLVSHRGLSPQEISCRMVEALARVFDVAVAAVIRHFGDDLEVEALWDAGEVYEGGRMPLTGSPCEQVRLRRTVQSFHGSLEEQFPDDDWFRQRPGLVFYCGTPIYDDAGELVGDLCILDDKPRDDDPERSKLLEVFGHYWEAWTSRSRQRARDQERQEAQRLESLGVMASGVAHDFNNLLSGILGSLDLVRMSLSSNHEALGHLSLAEQSSRQAAQLTQQLLAYAGKRRVEYQPLDLNQAVSGFVPVLKAAINHQLELEVELDSCRPVVTGDEPQLHQVLLNLVVNAAEASSDELVPITLRTQVVELAESGVREPGLDELPAGRYAALAVADRGRGMSPDLTRRIFDPFFSTNGLGRGLGLAVVSGIAKAHGGVVIVNSAVGEGTLFQILLPMEAPSQMDDQSRAEHDADEKVILIVDDEMVVREAARRILEHFGYKTLLASSGEEALQKYRDHPSRIALVLLDQSMPGKRGDMVFRELKEFDPEVCVVLTSGYSSRDVTPELLSEGLMGFVPKPFSADELLDEVSEHVPRPE